MAGLTKAGSEKYTATRSRISAVVEETESKIRPAKLGIMSVLRLGYDTPNKVLERSDLNVSFGCLDKAALIGSFLKGAGFQVFIVSEQTIHKGKAIALHFSLQVTDGENKFTVDPRTKGTEIFDGWSLGERESKLTLPLQGITEIVYRIIRRKEFPEDPMDTPSFKLVGINGRLDYIKLAKVNFLDFVMFLGARMRRKYNARIMKEIRRGNKGN